MNVIAIDWSGATDGASKTWLAEVDTSKGSVVRLEAGRSRIALADHLIAEAERNPNLVVGIDMHCWRIGRYAGPIRNPKGFHP